MAQDRPSVFTIGHSNHPAERFLALLQVADVTAVADVRSIPQSRYWPHFGRPRLERWLAEAGIAYVYLGAELGGRPRDSALLRDGQPDYDAMAAAPSFRAGLDRVLEKAARYNVALMCAEREPLDCHRFLLVSRHLHGRGARLRHILANGTIEPHAATEGRLLHHAGLAPEDLFANLPPPRDAVARAYDLRTARIGRSRHPAGQA